VIIELSFYLRYSCERLLEGVVSKGNFPTCRLIYFSAEKKYRLYFFSILHVIPVEGEVPNDYAM